MAESQDDIDALLAEVSALAEDAVAEVDDGEDITPDPTAEPPPPDAAPAELPAAPPGPATMELSRILTLEVPVIVELAARTMPLSEILNLSTGAIIEFEKPADSDLDLMINNECIGRGLAVKVGENFGLRVTGIGSVRDRIQALGGR